MKLIFLGTASCYPTPTRGVSCTALQLDDGQVWLFDCGEGSQIQLQKCKHLRGGRVSKIFITHLHGDHVFGLPGLLCTIGMGGNPDENRIVDIYGPHGLRKYLLTSLEMSRSMPAFQFNIHELMPKENQFPPEWFKLNTDFDYSGEAASYIGESSHRKIFPQKINDIQSKEIKQLNNDEITKSSQSEGSSLDESRCDKSSKYYWEVLNWDESAYEVKAAVLQHRIPCFGYVIYEKEKPGSLNIQKLKEFGLKPGPIFSQIKAGKTVQMDNGTVITPEEVMGPPKEGRKVAILGDTKDSSEMMPICQNCEVIVHEATNENSLKEQAVGHGHSTPEMAATFALEAKTKILCLTHVSPRYRPKPSTNLSEGIGEESNVNSDESYLFADRLKKEAQEYINKVNGNIDVLVAEDFMVLPVVKS